MFGRKKMNAQMLTDITRGIHHAVNTTGTMISQQYIMMFHQFFDTDEDGKTISAKMVKVQVDEQHDMLVPLIALVQPQGIALQNMRFEMSIQITESELKEAFPEGSGSNLDAKRGAFKVYLSPKTRETGRRRSDIVDVVMEFTRCEPPEGMCRVIEHYANMIQPFKSESAEQPEEPPEPTGPLAPGAPSMFAGAPPPKKTGARKLNIVGFGRKKTEKRDD